MLSHNGYACACGKMMTCPFDGQTGPNLWLKIHADVCTEPLVSVFAMPITWVSRTWVEVK